MNEEERKASDLVGTTENMDKRIKDAAEKARSDESLTGAGMSPANSTAEKAVELTAQELKRKTLDAKAIAPEIEAQKAAEAAAKREEEHAEVKGALHHDAVVKPLRTFKGDMAEYMNKEKASVISIKMAEKKQEDKPSAFGEPDKPSISKEAASISMKAVSLILSVVLVAVGIALLVAFQFGDTGGPIIGEKNDAILPYESEEEFALPGSTRDAVIAAFAEARSLSPKHAGAVFDLKFTKDGIDGEVPATSAEFLALMAPKAPQTLVRAFDAEFMAGTFGTSKAEPFIVFKVASFDNAFSGMLAWEETMPDEIGELLTADRIVAETGQTVYVQSPTIAASSTATSTASSTAPSSPTAVTYTNIGQKKPAKFEDLIVQNVDTRVARNESRQAVLIYAFIDKETLVITTNEAALTGITEKYRASKLVR